MTSHPTWQYDEFQQIGTDYESTAEVAKYDERMSSLRNIPEECASIIKAIGLKRDNRVLEIGTGTGEFAIAAAKQCTHVYATDVSQIMLDYAQKKSKDRGVDNITFTRAGFLTYEHSAEPLDAVVTQLALHHLPDFWKAAALRRIWRMMKTGGRLYIKDVVFSFDVDNAVPSLNNWIDGVMKQSGEEFGKYIEAHIRDEFSTYDWMMEGILRSVGFSISSANYEDNHAFAEYVCVKI